MSCDENIVLTDLRENALYSRIDTNSTNLNVKDTLNQLNYTATLLCSWKLSKHYYFTNHWEMGNITQGLSFAGDNENIVKMSKIASGLMQNAFVLDSFTAHSPHKYILNHFENNDIIMFNEAHDRVQTRAFVLSMLSQLKKAGAKFLAMETLNEKGNLLNLDASTGYYTAEPVSGQIFREALRLGYRIVAYEDTSLTPHTSNERDSIQAQNLYKRIKKNGGIEKTIVLAGYGHIDEVTLDSTYKTMAIYFKELSNIDPITVNQCNCIEENYLGIKVNLPNSDTCVALDKRSLSNLPFFEDFVHDITICHPTTKYVHGRPEWLITSDKKQFISLSIETDKKPVLIQAYLENEVKENGDLDFKIPFDQTFTLENGDAWFALERGQQYLIVYRDEHNNIILRKKISL